MRSDIHIIGAGAVGSLWASRLKQINSNVMFIAKKFQTNDFIVEYRGPVAHSAQTCSIPQQSAEQIECLKIVLVTVKSYQLAAALDSIKSSISPSTFVILMQNGMGNREIASQILPQCRLLLATHTHGAYLEPAVEESRRRVVHAGWGTTMIGPSDVTLSMADIPQLCQLLQHALPDVVWQLNIDTVLWKKLAINAAINPLTALSTCKNGELISNSELHNKMLSLIEEMRPVINFYCEDLQSVDLVNEIEQVATATGDNFSSMYQDVTLGRETEIEAITGFLLNKAQAIGMELPTHRALYQQLKK